MTAVQRPFRVNFAGRNYRLLHLVRQGLVAGSAVLVLAIIAITMSYLQIRAAIASIDSRLADLSAREEIARPLLAEREQFLRELTAMSALIESKRFSWTRLLTDLEGAFPEGVALSAVEYSAKDRSLSLDGTARSPEALRNLIVGLEQSRTFQRPHLKNQSIEKGSISFNVVVLYVGDAVAPDQRAPRRQGK